MKIKIFPEQLDEFIVKTDSLGGIGSHEVELYWENICYQSKIFVNENIDPFSEEYVEQQLLVYKEISGREINQDENEISSFCIEEHIASSNPYAHRPPSEIGLHLARLSRLMQHSSLKIGDSLLDMGCGWGLSSEFYEYCGLNVTGIDINHDFVRLVNTRAKNRNFKIKAIKRRFEGLLPDEFSAVAFYGCLHHAIRPWIALRQAHTHLNPGGKLLIAGEPIFNQWETWGIRLDPLSVYCIRKFGWFESGWTADFLKKCIKYEGFSISRFEHEGDSIGWTIVAEKISSSKSRNTKSGLIGLIKLLKSNTMRLPSGKICLEVSLEVENISELTWLKSDSPLGGVKLGVHLLDNNNVLVNLDYFRHNFLDTNFKSHNKKTVNYSIPYPENHEKFSFEIDLVSEGVCWFGENGSKTITVKIDESTNR